jgi:hypothetical protein
MVYFINYRMSLILDYPNLAAFIWWASPTKSPTSPPRKRDFRYPPTSEQDMKRRNTNLKPLTLTLSHNGEREPAESPPQWDGILKIIIKAGKPGNDILEPSDHVLGAC